MASKSQIVGEMMDEFGKSSSSVRSRIDRVVGEITVDLLSQADGRFPELEEFQEITITTSDIAYKVNSDFNAAKTPMIEVNSSGTFLRKISIVGRTEYYNRQADPTRYPGYTYAMVKYDDDGDDGAGDYLTLGSVADETRYFQFPYYRKATVDDTDLIRNTTILKTGVRSMFPEFNINYANDGKAYDGMRRGFKPSPKKRITNIFMRPSPRTQHKNKNQKKYGRGY